MKGCLPNNLILNMDTLVSKLQFGILVLEALASCEVRKQELPSVGFPNRSLGIRRIIEFLQHKRLDAVVSGGPILLCGLSVKYCAGVSVQIGPTVPCQTTTPLLEQALLMADCQHLAATPKMLRDANSARPGR